MKQPKTKTAAELSKSPAEFFASNKNIAGFDNPGKSLYTTVRELVENSLDAAESLGKLPDIEVTIKEITQKQLNTIREVTNHERLDEELYEDHETEEAKKKREIKESKERERLRKQLEKKGESSEAIESKLKDLQNKNAAAASKGVKTFYTVTVKDNGMGMKHSEIPDLLGRVLSGTKYGVKQTRGKFGLGAKMALIWSKMSTGLPIKIKSSLLNQSFISTYTLDIDIQRNEPNVHDCKMVDNPDRWHGSELSVTILGNWQYYRAKIIKYLRQIAVITPYSQFTFTFKAEDPSNDLNLVFARRTEKMPEPPKDTKHHPKSVDLELVKQLIQRTKYTKLQQFLCKEFDAINLEHAGRLIRESQSGAEPDTDPRELTNKQILMLHQLLHNGKFNDPTGHHLSPAGEYNLRLGITKELHPDLVATFQGDAHVLEGHAFIVEAAVSIGGRDIKPGINIFRFANRIPLLFEGGSDVITKTALKRISWPAYKINPTSDKVGVFVSIVSTKIPYKGAGKEYIADDMQEMVHAVKQSIQQCSLQLKVKIVKQQAARDQHQRRKNLVKYIPNAARAVFTVLESMIEAKAIGPKRKRMQSENDILAPVKQMRTSEDTLIARLTEHVEKIDNDMALEYQVQQGMAKGVRQDIFLVPLGAQHEYGQELHATTCVIKLLTGI